VVYRETLRRQRVPRVREMALELSLPIPPVRASLARLCASHAFMRQTDGELWRAAPFTPSPRIFRRASPSAADTASVYLGCLSPIAIRTLLNLGIPAMLGQNAPLDAAGGCCNYRMPIRWQSGKLRLRRGVLHVAVPARDWYKDVVFT